MYFSGFCATSFPTLVTHLMQLLVMQQRGGAGHANLLGVCSLTLVPGVPMECSKKPSLGWWNITYIYMYMYMYMIAYDVYYVGNSTCGILLYRDFAQKYPEGLGSNPRTWGTHQQHGGHLFHSPCIFPILWSQICDSIPYVLSLWFMEEISYERGRDLW